MFEFTKKPIVIAGESHAASICGWETTEQPQLVELKGTVGLYCFRGTWPRQDDYYEKLIYTLRVKKELTPVLIMRGNDHLASFLIRSERIIDFVSSKFPRFPIDEDARIIPEDLIEERFYNLYRGTTDNFRARVERCNQFISLATPPPKLNENFLRGVLSKEAHFREAVERKGRTVEETEFTPPFIRLKLWGAICRANERATLEAGGRFLWPPNDVSDDIGFLREEYYEADCTHANYKYGRKIIEFLKENVNKDDKSA